MTREELENLIVTGATRKCNKCMDVLPVTDFHIKSDKENKHWRFNSPCKSCGNINRNVNYQKAYFRKIKYNLTEKQYQEKLELQEFSCAICGIHLEDYSKDFSVDHCHTTGKIRGLLCQFCNSGIGFLKESPTIMKKAIKYIKQHSK